MGAAVEGGEARGRGELSLGKRSKLGENRLAWSREGVATCASDAKLASPYCAFSCAMLQARRGKVSAAHGMAGAEKRSGITWEELRAARARRCRSPCRSPASPGRGC
eukprot:1726823-Rhodomonas_salina.1